MSSSASIPMSSIPSQCIDPMEAFLEFGNASPSGSPSSLSSRPANASPNNTLLPPSDTAETLFSAPSHPYGSYRQHTGIPAGSIQELNRINQSSRRLSTDAFGDDGFDFGTAPTTSTAIGNSDLDMDFNSPSADTAFLFPERSLSSSTAGYINPNAIGGHEEQNVQPIVPTQGATLGRLWPGVHQQAAIAKAQAQAEQQKQQQIIQQQRRQQVAMSQQRQQTRSRSSQQPTDPIVEEKISQLLNSMRQSSVATPTDDSHVGDVSPQAQMPRLRKDEEEMDEDEKLLASEEGKKLSSKERRQLRNKVSARAFRSRRKEYISQLEGEVTVKSNEANDLRNQNRILREENKRLEDLTRMLLSSPQFSDFLDAMSTNPAPAPRQEQPPRQDSRQAAAPKDPNPFVAQQQLQQNGAHIGMALIPDNTMNLSMLDLNESNWAMGSVNSTVWTTNQPQVFAVTEVPEGPAVDQIDTKALSEKPSGFTSTYLARDSEKTDVPDIKHLPKIHEEQEETSEVSLKVEAVCDDSDPAFILYSDAPTSCGSAHSEEHQPLFGDKSLEQVFARVDLVDASEEEAQNIIAMDRFQRRCESIEASLSRIQDLISHL